MSGTLRDAEVRERIALGFQQASERYADGGDDAARKDGYDNVEDWFETQVAWFISHKMPAPERPGFLRADEWTLEGLVAYADQLGRKLEPTDVTPGLRRFATEWLRALPTPIDFEYLASMRFQLEAEKRNLTIPQAKGVLNCAVAAGRRAGRQAKPKAEAPQAPAVELEAAIYFKDNTVYKVKRAVHGSGHMYALALDPSTGKFEYAKGAVRDLRPEDRMTLEQAKEFGAIYGVCCNCGATLTAEDSIELGIGPICRKKFL